MLASTLLVVVLVCIGWSSVPGQLLVEARCGGRTVIRNATSGRIGDGDGNYPELSECEWVIVAPPMHFVTLTFGEFATECAYDFLFVHDGMSAQAPLLAALSGNQVRGSRAGDGCVHCETNADERVRVCV
jgi:hypothetical protein